MTEKVNHGQISLESLKTLGGFVPNAPVQREIEWADGLVTVYVRQLGIGAIERLMHHDNDERSINAKYIAETIALDAEGKVGFPYADAYRLKSDLANKLVEVAREVNSGK